MIYLFRIISDENPDFYRDLVAEGSDTFLDFHNVLQDELSYDASQISSFFITSDTWEKEQEITLIDMMQDPAMNARIMEEVTLDEYLDTVNQRMIYLFDFFSDRAFFIELIETSDEGSPKATPFIGGRKGDPPPQLKLDLMTEQDTMDDPFRDPEDDEDDIRFEDLDPDTLEDY